ncbi:hypothetical protein AX17_004555 [Amanita inopinata Kibby_2008]|nr:hypothetical protein AX17_004555 [Amanita inopinata Kibby_2008]
MSSRNIPVNDTEFERGRGKPNDSSSSRESSPLNKRKRQMTPPSDDEDFALPATADDDDTPAPERPLVREAVAFSWDPSKSIAPVITNINTYQASLPSTSSNSQSRFLPGQDPSTSKTRKRRERRTTPFSAQTSRFRLEGYDHSLNAQPTSQTPLQQGQGPYNSLYRANTSLATTPGNVAITTAGPGILPSRHSSPQFSSKRSRLVSAPSRMNGSTQEDFFDSASLLTMPDTLPYSIEQGNSYFVPDFQQHHSGEPHISPTSDQIQGEEMPVPQHTFVPTPPQPNSSSNAINLPSLASGGRTQNPEPADKGPNTPTKRSGFHNRMITILIHDIRSGRTDRQLAEVTIPVKMADDPQDGFWADAKDISERLQSSPSRIDGPARVYTLRGKYRQIFLRVSADNVDNFASANVGISPDRTLDVVVEKPPEPGTLPQSPQIPAELLPSSPEMEDISPSETGSEVQRNKRPMTKGLETKKSSNRKSQRSRSSSDNDSEMESRARDKRTRRKRSMVCKKSSKGSHSKDVTSLSALDHLPSFKNLNNPMGHRTGIQAGVEEIRGYDSPTSDVDPNTLYDLMVRAVESIIHKQSEWPAFPTWRSSTLPDLLKAYKFMQRMMDELVGELAPFRSKSHEIRKSHVLAALRVEPKVAAECTETLKLLKLYGEKGTRNQDSRAIGMINRAVPYRISEKPQKRLLRLLRSIHDDWKQNHAGAHSETMASEVD